VCHRWAWYLCSRWLECNFNSCSSIRDSLQASLEISLPTHRLGGFSGVTYVTPNSILYVSGGILKLYLCASRESAALYPVGLVSKTIEQFAFRLFALSLQSHPFHPPESLWWTANLYLYHRATWAGLIAKVYPLYLLWLSADIFLNTMRLWMSPILSYSTYWYRSTKTMCLNHHHSFRIDMLHEREVF
jgi:hypothetical protein